MRNRRGWTDRYYRVLLLAWPSWFRRAYGEEMREAFRDRCAAARARGGRAAVLRLTVTASWDVVRNGLIERFSPGPEEPRGVWLGSHALAGSFRQAVRRLARAPTFALATVASVSLGVGAFASVASVADGVLLDGLPYEDADRLLWVWRDYSWADFPRGWLGGPDIAYLREHSDVFDGVVGFRSGRVNLTGTAGAAPEEARVLLATDDFFEVLGVRPMLGRGFEPGESLPGSPPVAVLSHSLWQARWGADPGVIGRDVTVDGEMWTVVGVMAPDFRFVKHSSLGEPEPADLYGTLRMDLASLNVGFGGFAGLARVRPGVSPAAIDAALATAAAPLDDFFGDQGLRLWSVDLRSDLVGEISPALVALAAAASFLLLILTANLATLLYGRAEERSRDVAVRTALGGSRLAAVSGIVAEGLVVTVAGCAVGLLLARAAVGGLLALAPESLPRREAIDLDASVIGATVALAVLMGLLAALGPAWRVSSRAAAQVLRSSDPRAGGGTAVRTRSGLVVLQVALSLVLLVGAGLVGRSASLLLAANPGFDPAGVLTFRVPLDDTSYPDDESVARMHAEVRSRVGSLPGVTVAGGASALPLTAGSDQGPIAFPGAEGNTGNEQADSPLVDEIAVTPGYFEAMRIRMVAGRAFVPGDVAGGPMVAVIDRTLAERFFPAGDAVGRTAHYLGDTLAIVGVVDHARMYNVYADDRGQVYLPAAQHPDHALYYAVRTDRDPLALLPDIRAAVLGLDSSVPVSEAQPATALIRESLGRHRLTLVLLAAFAGGALLLAAMGIYGVVAGGVIRRTPEIGVRLALGATRGRVLRLVAADAVRVIVIGLAVGLGTAVLASRLLESLLFGVRASDPLTYAGVAFFLLAIATLSCVVPALRAVRIEPASALRRD